MPETVHPDSDDAADSDSETEEETTEQADDEEDEAQFYIPAPGGLRGL